MEDGTKLGEIVAVVEEGIAVKLEAAAVEGVCAILENLVECRSRVTGVFGVHGAGDDVLFLESVRIDEKPYILIRTVIDVRSVEHKGVLRRLVAVAGVAADAVGGLDDAWLELLQA